MIRVFDRAVLSHIARIAAGGLVGLIVVALIASPRNPYSQAFRTISYLDNVRIGYQHFRQDHGIDPDSIEDLESNGYIAFAEDGWYNQFLVQSANETRHSMAVEPVIWSTGENGVDERGGGDDITALGYELLPWEAHLAVNTGYYWTKNRSAAFWGVALLSLACLTAVIACPSVARSGAFWGSLAVFAGALGWLVDGVAWNTSNILFWPGARLSAISWALAVYAMSPFLLRLTTVLMRTILQDRRVQD